MRRLVPASLIPPNGGCFRAMGDREALEAIAEIIRAGRSFRQDPLVTLEDIESLLREQVESPQRPEVQHG